ncbi:hypothetical protein [Litoribacter populi]|uniref:hypothetical protein n=1 Tax=Litoribacter populi TaxID=2598460 RepID=UPI00117DE9DF|nr:hypothetical protein [Litoribacter populi]
MKTTKFEPKAVDVEKITAETQRHRENKKFTAKFFEGAQRKNNHRAPEAQSDYQFSTAKFLKKREEKICFASLGVFAVRFF